LTVGGTLIGVDKYASLAGADAAAPAGSAAAIEQMQATSNPGVGFMTTTSPVISGVTASPSARDRTADHA
jgi:hypothetical protein